MPELSIRRMRASDLDGALKLTQSQGWPHRLEDWQFHHRLGRGWVACAADGTLLGIILWVPCGATFGTLGLVVVEPNQQGRGIGRRLMDAVLADAGPRTLQLVSTQAGLKLYRQCGFREIAGIVQHQGIPFAAAAATVVAAPDTLLRAVTPEDLAALCAFDAAAFGADRRATIRQVTEAGSGVLAEKDGRLAGFALTRPFGRGSVVGPIIAADQGLALALLSASLPAGSGFTRVDVPAAATDLIAWLEAAGLAGVDRGTTMLRGDAPAAPAAAAVFGLISHALN